MFQEKVNGNVDCLYKWQVDETQHQDGRVSWSLVVNTLLFTILYTKYNEDYSALILLNILMGIVTSVSIFYSVRVGELATGTVYEKWDAYDHQSIKEKCKPIPHVISLAPSTILRSKWNFISFYTFIPNVFCVLRLHIIHMVQDLFHYFLGFRLYRQRTRNRKTARDSPRHPRQLLHSPVLLSERSGS